MPDVRATVGTPVRELNDTLRRVVARVALMNLGYFGIEFGVALAIGSVSLFADSVDFLEDALINLLILIALGWSAHRRSQVGMMLAAILLVPGIATFWTAWDKVQMPVPPAPPLLSLTGGGALAVNFACALMLARYRAHAGSLTRAAFLSARNDVLSHVAIIGAGLLTAYTASAWPDLVVDPAGAKGSSDRGATDGVFTVEPRGYLEENVGALDVRLTPAELAKIDSILPPGAAAGPRHPERAMRTINR